MRRIDRMIPTSYAEALDRITRKDGTFMATNLCNNTRLVPIEDEHGKMGFKPVAIGLVLHATTVVTYHLDGTISINSGGWRTVTTKARINSALRRTIYRVVQRGGEWLLSGDEDARRGWPFEDGVRLVTSGYWLARR